MLISTTTGISSNVWATSLFAVGCALIQPRTKYSIASICTVVFGIETFTHLAAAKMRYGFAADDKKSSTPLMVKVTGFVHTTLSPLWLTVNCDPEFPST